ncbi:ATP-binding cassette subfamily F protein 3 [Thermosporothrix hazakensis]|jgi:ATP-binding cassette subfamily F protein 3|uniref:ATP-binding cassette subfamily F protein 3 n=1 Tax=Thermosporothrix hazakensis TaxID=644383 RepID=A0A326U985_THEHA|nr:ABC-F family ATP-binding cassette domain-containing protein [Thermosporothrix hazakensis]PZW31977.1 ATP-binding cassette subfamily F protein 3 [Thermosporothrix hazakensis]GCE49697.1 ABC transporter [Thermosporothrix hazakensis]
MPIVTVTNLAKSFGAELIFSDVSFQVDPGDRIGLVGPNGAGKSTLLNILAGREEPDAGEIAVARNVRIGYLSQMADFQPGNTLREEMLTVFAQVRQWEQELSALAQRMSAPEAQAQPAVYEQLLQQYAELQTRFEHAGGYTYEHRVSQVLDGLGFTREQQDAPFAQLSGGQKTRASLGKLLLQEPDVLLLDEPTNHLDLESLEWLEEYLSSWSGAMLIVAHDRYFLDKVVTRTIELAFGHIEEYPGNYTKYLSLREERMERRLKEYEAQQAYIARTEEFIRRYKAGQRSKEARGRQKLLDRMERIERPQDFAEMHFELSPVMDSGRMVLSARKLIIGFKKRHEPSEALFQCADLELERGDRIGLLGPNGSGKTTLLRTIIGEIPALGGHIQLGHNVRIGYYSQTHSGLDMDRTIIDEIRQVSALSEEGARSFLGRFLFSGDDVFKPIHALSGGERSRVALAKLTLQGANFLILDEPTNHLDLQSRQFLEEVMSEFEGSLLFVSHDRYFVDRLATKIWAIEEGVLIPYQGNYTEYRRFKRPLVLDKPTVEKKQTVEKKPEAAPTRNKKRTRTKTRTIEDVEREIEKAESRVKELETALSEAALQADADELMRLNEDYEQAKARVDALLSEWEELADVAS